MFADLSGKVALITGSGQGIGAGIARVFATAGAKVMVVNRTPENGQRTVDEILEAGGEAELCGVDIGSVESVERAVAETIKKWGGIDIMLHNAASFLGGSVDAYNEEDLETVLSVNLKACFRFSKAVIPHFRKRGGGRLLFTSSVTGPRVAMPGTSYYAASKGGMNAFIRTAALELARENITVNGVEPGYIRTAAMELLADEEGLAQMTKYIPTGYMGAPEDIAYCMLYLASDEARYITGQTICIDGGSTLPESPVFLEEMDGIKDLEGSA
ncbi:MAG: SDR family oxidoreductase [Gammaproteobacteria bacterium]|jgi:3-oxoacyl-[acyl-carrier protein] reductase|nr:SDR family oxidoreductase [Gammaproteobacteria bacterium]